MTLQEFFGQYPEVAVAFSGGVDSAFLLEEAAKYARRVTAYYVNSEFQPRFERRDALRVADQLGVRMKVLPLEVLAEEPVGKNPPDRCYFCKKAIFTAIAKAAREDGFSVLLDGTNASDDAKDRPGMRALAELSVLSPLRQCGLTKEEIRQRSKEAGLFTWDKPAYACLATRILTGEEITVKKLAAVEEAEDWMASLGFTDFRVRTSEGQARLQIRESQWPLLWEHRAEILEKLKENYRTVSLDLEVRK